eukprot:1114779-Rhodomonas_salina.2
MNLKVTALGAVLLCTLVVVVDAQTQLPVPPFEGDLLGGTGVQFGCGSLGLTEQEGGLPDGDCPEAEGAACHVRLKLASFPLQCVCVVLLCICGTVMAPSIWTNRGVLQELAFCEVFLGEANCYCFEGVYGDGTACTTESGSIRFSFKMPSNWEVDDKNRLTSNGLAEVIKLDIMQLWDDQTQFVSERVICSLAPDPYYSATFTYAISGPAESRYFTAIVLFEDLAEANRQLSFLKPQLMNGSLAMADGVRIGVSSNPDLGVTLHFGTSGQAGQLSTEPRAYEHVTGTTKDPLLILPTGLTVEDVFFRPACLSSGCWVIDVVYTTGGEDNSNVFYVPRSDNSDTLSYDASYAGSTTLATYTPSNFPCGNDQYDPAQSETQGYIPTTVSACCIPDFIDSYTVIASFEGESFGDVEANLTTLRGLCPETPPEMSIANKPASALHGVFAGPGMTESYVEHTGIAPV